MFGPLGKALGAAKDKAFETSAKAILNSKIGNFGRVTRLQIDSTRKTLVLEVELKGEVAPISIQVHRYDVVERGGETFVRVEQVDASREWIGLALNQYLVGQEFKIPGSVGFGL